ncbi:MAG: hypothetical protein IJM76_08610 [Lachnospiraceae bacterium]|nr:hypothetical protein [Lachnospiraceae bacterium]
MGPLVSGFMIDLFKPMEGDILNKEQTRNAISYYRDWIFTPRLNTNDYVKKLSQTFSLRRCSFDELAPLTKKNLALNNLNTPDLCWIVESDERSRIFEMDFYSKYPKDQSCLCICYYKNRGPEKGGVFTTAGGDLLNPFLRYYRGIDEEHLEDADFEAESYCAALHYMIRLITVMGPNRMRRIRKNAFQEYAYRKDKPRLSLLPGIRSL